MTETIHITSKHDVAPKEGSIRVTKHEVRSGFGDEDGEYTETVARVASEDQFVEAHKPVNGDEKKKKLKGGVVAVSLSVETAIDTEDGFDWVPYDDLRLEKAA